MARVKISDLTPHQVQIVILDRAIRAIAQRLAAGADPDADAMIGALRATCEVAVMHAAHAHADEIRRASQ